MVGLRDKGGTAGELKGSAPLRIVELLVQARTKVSVRSHHLWIIAGLMAVLGYAYYDIVPAHHDVYVVLFFYPLMYAAIVFRLPGVVSAWLVSMVILAPHAALYAGDPYSISMRFLIATFGFIVSGLVAAQLSYLERQLEAYREIVTLNEELNKYIERLERTQVQLIQAEKLNALGQLAASIAHEINNPLAGALVYSRLVQKKLGGNSFDKEEALTNLSKVEAAVGRCSRIVRGLLDFARQTEPVLQPVAVSAVIDQVISLVGYQAEMKHVQVAREEGPQVPLVMADAGQLQQVFTNLVLNAIQAMPDRGKLTIATSVGGDRQVTVSFQDTGSGIPPEHLAKLFTPFFTTKEKGLGLGLAVSHGIIERHGGRMEVDSEVGKGSTFAVHLPAIGSEGGGKSPAG